MPYYIKCPVFNKNSGTDKEMRTYVSYIGEKNESIKIVSKEAQILDSLDKYLKLAILNINMFRELKETMSKELKGSGRMMSHQIGNINKET